MIISNQSLEKNYLKKDKQRFADERIASQQ
jgi:hypothetical protein